MEDELKEFRNKWKDELTAGPSSKQDETLPNEGDTKSDNHKKAAETESLVGASTSKQKHEEVAVQKRSLSDAERIRSLPNTLEPFLLAERLLEESNNTATPSRTITGAGHFGSPPNKRLRDVDSRDHVSGTEISKRRKADSNEGYETKPNNYLDAFLADLVSDNQITSFKQLIFCGSLGDNGGIHGAASLLGLP